MRDFPLHSQTIRGYDSSAPAKSGVGIGVPEQLSVTNDAPASFLLSALTHTQIMVGWVGASHEAPVSDNAGYANLAQSTTSEIGVSGGGITYPLSEAAIMATIPISSHPKFVWLFLGTPKGTICAPVSIRVAADTEDEARSHYPDHHLVFAAKIRSECSVTRYGTGVFEVGMPVSFGAEVISGEVRHV
ncbi:ash family protein [Salmonella enterica]|nr:host cell division inhibitor Icd-like protein [Salmonella enterica]EAR5545556.1 host cell division inhibitor Icd-like protein [Salmonella enterica]EAT3229569.1 host cell division inhibitor Icd-like protein [Salmonella enterica]EBF2167734.1 host cell division inhibitor Icd-like protein [Salmonella enterica]EBI4450104.1 hypothetical protein [Salmonella enterica]